MSKRDNEEIKKLLDADKRAKEIIDEARATARANKRNAERDAMKEVQRERANLREERGAALDEKDSAHAEFKAKVKTDTQKQLSELKSMVSSKKATAVSMILHKVGTVKLEVTADIIKAFQQKKIKEIS